MRYSIIILLSIICFFTWAQEKVSKVRSIEVKGSSEVEITPNEIFVSLTLKEYKKGGVKVSLDKLESNLVKALKNLKIPEEKLTVQNIYGYNWNWRKRKAEDFLGSKIFLLEVNDLKQMNDLVESTDPEGLNKMNVQSYSHSDIEAFRKEVKIAAMKAAKEKAIYLLESVGETVGKILEIEEMDYGYREDSFSNFAYRSEAAKADYYESNVDFKKIKVRAEMRVVFEIEE
ncbi:MAG: SIMPL domain-containing protein [Bacteroidota bacterium]